MSIQILAQKVGECRFWGLAADTKPDVATSSGFGFYESDTARTYICDGVSWNLVLAADYATAAQGTLASTALQPAGNGGSLTGLTKTQVGLANADNTTDAGKPVSTATQSALDGKQATLVSATNIKTINGATVLGSGDLTVSAGDPSYSPGSFTVATETQRFAPHRLQMTTSQRITAEGTGRLSCLN